MGLASKSRTELIDQALDGQSAEVKARVLSIIIRYDIDVRNEFFLIFVAIGHLLAIVEEAPENWRRLFDEFERKLDEWSEQNLRTLAAIHQQGEAAERMSQNFLRLTDSLKLSTTKTSELQSDLIKLSRTLASLNNGLVEVKAESKTSLRKVEALSQTFKKTELVITDIGNHLSWIWGANIGVITATVACLCLFGWSTWQQQVSTNEQNERLGWLVEKANREECWYGIKPADDPQCLRYQ